MTNEQWQQFLDVINGKKVNTLPVGFIIDSPWLPGWAGINILEYYANPEQWFSTNMKAEQTFPDVWFLPGFWREFGMCSEPSAFGASLHWALNDFPHAGKIISDINDSLPLKPNVRTDGLGPLLLQQLVSFRSRIEDSGHSIRFAVARGPLNIVSFLMGTTEFLMAMKLEPEKIHNLLKMVSNYLVDWLQLQCEAIDSIDGILLLDDIIGFISEDDFVEFAKPYLTQIFSSFDASVKFLHDDTPNLIPMSHLSDMGVNLVNPSDEHSFAEMRKACGNKVTILNGLPPRDCLARDTPEEVYQATKALLSSIDDPSRIILSCGGGMPPEVQTENIRAMARAASEKKFSIN